MKRTELLKHLGKHGCVFGRRWFFDRDWEKWDREIEADAKSGKLDFLLHEATEATRDNRLKDL